MDLGRDIFLKKKSSIEHAPVYSTAIYQSNVRLSTEQICFTITKVFLKFTINALNEIIEANTHNVTPEIT